MRKKKQKAVRKPNIKRLTLLNSLLKYCEGIAYKYYLKHYRIFESDATSVTDLKQEAKIVCLKVFKTYYKMNGKNGFNLKKFIARAVGWRMRDLMKQAITESEVFVHQGKPCSEYNPKFNNPDGPVSSNVTELNNHRYDKMFPDMIYGFNIEQIFSHFDEKDLTIIKFMIKYKDEEHDFKKFFKNKKLMYVHWVKRLKPKLQELITNYRQESK